MELLQVLHEVVIASTDGLLLLLEEVKLFQLQLSRILRTILSMRNGLLIM